MIQADMVIINGKVATVDKKFSIKEAIAVKQGRIIDVGENNDIKRLTGPDTEVIDLKGKLILPGTHDAHMHGVGFGYSMSPSFMNLYFPFVKSLKDMKNLLSERVKKAKPGEWLNGMGWNTAQMVEFAASPGRMLTKADIDDVTPDNPVIIHDFSSHVMLVNSKALEQSGIDKNTPDPLHGAMGRDPATGEPDGLFFEYSAHAMVAKNVPQPKDADLREYIRLCQSELNKNGITSYNDAGLGLGGDHIAGGTSGSKCIEVYQEMCEAGELTCRVSIGVFPGIDGVMSYDSIAEGLKRTRLPNLTDPHWVSAAMGKIWGDGIPTNNTSWMWENYKNADHHGRSNFPGESDEEQYNDFLKTVKFLHKNGWQIAVHATGDRMIDMCIEAYISAMQEFPGKAPRHYIVHGDFTTLEQAKRAAGYHIGLSSQPSIASLVFNDIENTVGSWAHRMAATRDYLSLGLNVAAGSDASVTYPNWRAGVQAAVTRKCPVNGKVYSPEYAVSVEDAVRMYTINGAYQEHMENFRGSIEIGKVADFQVLSDDIFKAEKEKIGEIQVELTIVGGKIVYSAY